MTDDPTPPPSPAELARLREIEKLAELYFTAKFFPERVLAGYDLQVALGCPEDMDTPQERERWRAELAQQRARVEALAQAGTPVVAAYRRRRNA